ncbi:MAG TPA: 4-(cytidine 5'-diphospho)-2-C-methyl-D-erythritol kinase [Chitinophagaceae bacterium]
MIVFPNCKLNLGLHILRKRSDGFHDLETVFYPLPLQDALEIVQSEDKTSPLLFTTSGLPVDGIPEDNICYKAYHLLKECFPQLPPVKMHLHKSIPMGAGLGGGSADGAFTLHLLNKKFNLGLNERELTDLALQLGSDAPFFILNQPCYATGRGEKMEPLQLDLSAYKILIVNPGIHINTGWAFRQIVPTADRPSLKDRICQPVEQWKDLITNDFESPVSAIHPEIGAIKEALYSHGATYAAMSGSGSTVFGLFPKTADFQGLSFPTPYFVKEV